MFYSCKIRIARYFFRNRYLQCKRATSWAVAGTDFQHKFAPMLHKPESVASQGNAAEEAEEGEKMHMDAWKTSTETYTVVIIKI